MAIDGDGVLVAHAADQCAGLAVTRYAGATAAQPGPTRCAEGVDVSPPTAIAVIPNGTLVWSGDTIVVIP